MAQVLAVSEPQCTGLLFSHFGKNIRLFECMPRVWVKKTLNVSSILTLEWSSDKIRVQISSDKSSDKF